MRPDLRQDWQPRPGDRVIRHPRQDELGPITVSVEERRAQSRSGASPLMIVAVFGLLFAAATVLLLMPFAHHGDGMTPFLDALFTAASAVTATGLVVQETSAYWTPAGQAVLLGTVFVGGLGYMVLATFFLALVGHRFALGGGHVVREGMSANQLGGLARLAVGITGLAIGVQLAGFAALAARFWFIYSPEEAIWQAAFHAVSGFNNAGFVALREPEGLAAYQRDGFVIGVMAVMIVLGAVGYVVVVDVVRRRRFSLLGLNTKLVLTFAPILMLLGAGLFLLFEYANPATLGALPVSGKLMTAAFEAVNITAGFSTIDYAGAAHQTGFVMSGLMFVGGASASVAGGIKVNTLAVVIVAVACTMRGRTRATAYGREIPDEQVRRALVVAAASIVAVFLIVLALTFTNPGFDFFSLVFESASAFATVGMSAGITSDLSPWGRLVLITAMFAGRIGPLVIVIAMARKSELDPYRYAQERVTIG